jgi:hypothetical protein
MKKVYNKEVDKKIWIPLVILCFTICFTVIAGRAYGLNYLVQYGGRILVTVDIAVCSDPYTASACTFCGPGAWYQVVIQPAGGSGNYFCPNLPAKIGTNPTYQPGGYVMTGGSSPYSLDPINTGSVLGVASGHMMMAVFRVLSYISNL